MYTRHSAHPKKFGSHLSSFKRLPVILLEGNLVLVEENPPCPAQVEAGLIIQNLDLLREEEIKKDSVESG
jgi:hypothetical protein